MTSNISPTNINGAYPVAGQDNDSQGFRDNFTNIRNNFTAAKSEIEALQNSSIVKAQVNDLTGTTLTNAKIRRFTTTFGGEGNAVTGDVIISANNADFHKVSTSGPVKLVFEDWATTNLSYSSLLVLIHVNSDLHFIELPEEVTIGTSNIPGYNSSTHVIDAVIGDYLFEFGTYDGGSSVSIICHFVPGSGTGIEAIPTMQTDILALQADDVAVHDAIGVTQANVATLQSSVTTLNTHSYLGSAVLPASSAVDLTKSAATFTPITNTTATMAAGTEGKVFSLCATNVFNGSLVVTVTNPAWSTGIGTVTFGTSIIADGLGVACTLQYINNKWYCIGNNGAVFN